MKLSYLSHVFVSWFFHLASVSFEHEMSESSGDGNMMLCKSLRKYYRGTLRAQSRRATSPSNSQDPAAQVPAMGSPQSQLSLAGVPRGWAQRPTQPSPRRPHPGFEVPTLAPTKAFTAKSEPRPRPGGFPKQRGCGSTWPRCCCQPQCMQAQLVTTCSAAAGHLQPQAQPSLKSTGVFLVLSLSCSGQLKTFCFHKPHIFINLDFYFFVHFP